MRLLPLLLFGCSLVVPADQQQCETDEDCAMRGFGDAVCEAQLCVAAEVDPVWGCLGRVEEPMATPGAMHTVETRVIDALTQLPPAGLTIRLCSSLDLSCDSPVIDNIETDAMGTASVRVTSGFQGYFEVTSDTTMPALLPIGPVVEDGVTATEPVQLVSMVILNTITNSAGFTFDETKGGVLFLLTGCDQTGRAGVSFSSDAPGDAFYLFDLSPDTMALESDDSGQGGIINLDPGAITVTTTRRETGQFIARHRVPIRAATLTYAPMIPTASP